ncbi:ABC transporter ATP-binding protein [Halobaculum sp. CBA1158]|uniref:ABC transporter ATP-binding protein n=1 Tax=Halobaculum sp. CBA1158 TaxID=2904243 RepID=UPI001F3B18D5|nr:ABC transporter ATP-binding protein [Halobaculum sp. CBA1158]UIP00577.1 ABC transporter ATP-binding protein [Halobaculum sp. CBA1158]
MSRDRDPDAQAASGRAVGNDSATAGGDSVGDGDRPANDPLVVVEDLERHYPIRSGLLRRRTGAVRAVDGVSFEIGRGEALGLIGESGSGKSTVAETLLRLDEPTGGTVRFDGTLVAGGDRDGNAAGDAGDAGADSEALSELRRRTAMVFQDPSSSLDPRMTVGESAAEPLSVRGVARGRRRERVATLFDRVGLSPDHRDRYPHELSGGQKRRVSIARALALDPEFVVLDEPTAALDVSVQAEILGLLEDLRTSFDLSMLFISHDVSVIREACDRVAVMYAGEVVETGPTAAVLDDPAHPYTRALSAAVPTPDPRAGRPENVLSGAVPDPADPPDGCRFHTRCPEVIPPEGSGLTSEEYGAVIDFRVALADGAIDPDGLRDPADGDDETALADALRAEYDLPDPDGEAGRALDDAVARAAAGDAADAASLLRESFESVCVRESPRRTPVGDAGDDRGYDDGRDGDNDDDERDRRVGDDGGDVTAATRPRTSACHLRNG